MESKIGTLEENPHITGAGCMLSKPVIADLDLTSYFCGWGTASIRVNMMAQDNIDSSVSSALDVGTTYESAITGVQAVHDPGRSAYVAMGKTKRHLLIDAQNATKAVITEDDVR